MQKIMFNDRFLLTQAVLEGRMAQTRRIVTPQPYYDEKVGMVWKDHASGRGSSDFGEPQASYRNFVHHSKYKVGEIVAVAQSYSSIVDYLQNPKNATCVEHFERNCLKSSEILYEADGGKHKGWRNKMFVRSEACPHQIRITNVRVQRLQDISDEDCIKEGIEEIGMIDDPGYIYPNDPVYQTDGYDTPQEAYASLIDRINGKGTWDSNPYVFVYDFELVK